MGEENAFTARILESSASGLAGYAAATMVAESADLGERYGPGALGSWRGHLTQRIRELAAALATGEPDVFIARILWSRRAFAARGRPREDLELSLTALRQVLAEKLPPAAAAAATADLDRALEALRSAGHDEGGSDLEPEDTHGRMALAYLEDVLEGRARQAVSELERALEEGTPAITIISRVLLPAQREIGRLWHLGRASIAEEHLVTAATQQALAMLSLSASPEPANGLTLVAAGVAGNAHELGLRAVATVFELAGWQVVYLGSDVPTDELPGTLTLFQADLLLLSAMLSQHLGEVARAIEKVRGEANPGLKILVGGSVFDEAPSVWKRVGADGYAGSLESALETAADLVGRGQG